jgi:hypothetical protein
MCPADIQVWWIKRPVRGIRSYSIHHGSNQVILTIDITQQHQRWFGFRRKVASQQMMILSAARLTHCDVPDRYPSMVDQTTRQKPMKPQHSPWLESEYPCDSYNENTDGGSVSEEKLHHSR